MAERLLAARLFWLLFAVGMLLRLAFALLPLEMHLLLLEDDAWMVAAIARNFALGRGISADGVYPTTGFHPLYPLTLGALPYLLWPHDLAWGFRANLLLCALLNGLAALPLYTLLRRYVAQRLALAGVALFALNPLLVRYSVNAMETSLALLLLLTLAWAWATLDRSRPSTALALGVLAALSTLARLDTALFGAAIGLIWILDWGAPIQNPKPKIQNPLLYAATAALLLLPYFARNYLVTGSLTPSSGRALAYMHSYAESFALGSGAQIAFYQSLLDLAWLPSAAAGAAAIILALGLGWWLIPRDQRRVAAPALLYTAILTFYYAYVQAQGQPRYYVGVSVLLLLPLALALEGLGQRFGLRRAAWVAAGLLVLSLALNTVAPLREYAERARRPQAQPAMYAAARWISANLPSDAVLAARNSGIYQYYSGRLVINIDGKLNYEIVPVLERRGLLDYLRANRVDYLVDLAEVCGYVEFYSRQYSAAPPHRELSAVDKLGIYASMALRKLGLGSGPQLDAPVPGSCQGAFIATAPVYHTFPLPNSSAEAVTIFGPLQR
jgi:hypothetical protein